MGLARRRIWTGLLFPLSHRVFHETAASHDVVPSCARSAERCLRHRHRGAKFFRGSAAICPMAKADRRAVHAGAPNPLWGYRGMRLLREGCRRRPWSGHLDHARSWRPNAPACTAMMQRAASRAYGRTLRRLVRSRRCGPDCRLPATCSQGQTSSPRPRMHSRHRQRSHSHARLIAAARFGRSGSGDSVASNRPP